MSDTPNNVVILTSEAIAFGRGRQAYKRRAECPPDPGGWGKAKVNTEQAYWLGWMCERALSLLATGEVS